MLPACSSRACPSARRCPLQDYANIFWGLGALQLPPSDAWLQTAWAETGARLATAARAQPQARVAGQPEEQQQWEQDLAVDVEAGPLASYNSSSLSGVNSDDSGIGGSEGSLESSGAAEGPGPPLDERDVAHLAWGAAALRLRPPAGWLCALWAASAPGLPRYGAQPAATLLWALARLGRAAAAGGGPGASTLAPPLAWVHAALAAVAADLASLQPQGAVQLLWALAALRHRPSPGFMRDALARLQLELHLLPPGGFAAVLSSLAALGYSPGPTWWASCWYCLTPKAAAMDAGELGAAASAAAALRATPPPAAAAALGGRALALLLGAAPPAAGPLLLALARLGWRPDGGSGAAAVLAACERVLRAPEAKASGADAVAALRATAALGLAPPAVWLAAAEAALLACAGSLPPRDAAAGVVQLAALGGAPPQAWVDAMMGATLGLGPPLGAAPPDGASAADSARAAGGGAAAATADQPQQQAPRGAARLPRELQRPQWQPPQQAQPEEQQQWRQPPGPQAQQQQLSRRARQKQRPPRPPVPAEELDALAAALAGWGHVRLDEGAVRSLLAARLAAAESGVGVGAPLPPAAVAAWEALAARCGA
jgi:hypothetical protein